MAGKIRPEQLGTAAAITSLLNAADAAGARSVLGLGSLATKSTVGYAEFSASVGGRNQLANSSFEIGTTGWAGANLSTFTVATTPKMVGTQSLKLTTGTAGGITYAAASVPVRPNTAYVVSAWVNVESVTAGAELNRAMWVDDGTAFVTDTTLGTSHPVGVWTRKVLRITAGASATTLTVRLYCPQGTVYWDCVQVEEGDVPTAWSPRLDDAAARKELGLGALAVKDTVGYADIAATISGRNLLANSSAENGSVGWSSAGLSSLAASTEQSFDGGQSLKLTAATAGGVTYAVASASVKPSTTYVVSAWLYVDTITAAAEYNRALALYDGTVFVSETSLTTGHETATWTRKVLRITTGAAAATLYVRLYCPQGTVYWDCVQVEEGDVPTAWRPAADEDRKLLPFTATQTSPVDGTAWIELEEGMGQGFISILGPGGIGTVYEQNARVRARIGGVDFYATMEKA